MKNSAALILILIFFAFSAWSQEYEQYIQQGKESYEKADFVNALNQFMLAYEYAYNDSIEAEILIWKDKVMEGLRKNQEEFNSLKIKSESAFRLAIKEPKTRANANKLLYELSKNKGMSHFNKKNYYDAIQFFKLAKVSPDYIPDPEIDEYLKKSVEALNSVKKIALVIGNANYVEANLEKAIIDAQDMSKTLKSMNFDVIEGYNLKTPQFDEKVKQLYEQAKGYDLVLFFYTGFGFKSDNLLPVDTKLDAEGNLKSWFSLNYIMAEFLKYSTARKIFILDMDRTSNNQVIPMLMSYHNCMVFYSAAPANKAFNGVGRNSLFTEQLLKFISMPNTSFYEIFKLTREATMRVSKNRQVPTLYDNIQDDIYLNWKAD